MTQTRMPVLFAGHGSPMSAIENSADTKAWQALGKQIPQPRAVLSISAHWYTDGSRIQTSPHPKQIYDMYGFPQELYDLKYRPAGDPALAAQVQSLVRSPAVHADNTWGIDHGTWAVLCKIFPKADIPVVQLSVNSRLQPDQHYAIGKALSSLRSQGVLIFASGDVVHNLRRIDWDKEDGFDWADSFDTAIRDAVLKKDHETVIHYDRLGRPADLSVPTPEHFLPLLYALGASDDSDQVTVFNDRRTLGSLSMTGYLFQPAAA